ncbi:hypothetical protein EUU22_09255 [Ciceribacter ferrooxidans]|uniref:Lytic murein transglycosylase n=1 Tax=Ciceribacter ferrooxidans TaxID=2509717 RepID=A0A4Q2TDX4_9HYPH|nr:hypothetical protein EUU22_09255 [Ciceribacter ferrooxidans]
MPVPYLIPLWPAGHLPHKGGDRRAAGAEFKMHALKVLPPRRLDGLAGSVPRSLSPLVGEMAGRPEGVFF